MLIPIKFGLGQGFQISIFGFGLNITFRSGTNYIKLLKKGVKNVLFNKALLTDHSRQAKVMCNHIMLSYYKKPLIDTTAN